MFDCKYLDTRTGICVHILNGGDVCPHCIAGDFISSRRNKKINSNLSKSTNTSNIIYLSDYKK